MKTSINSLSYVLRLAACVAIGLAMSSQSWAQEAKPDGTWTWTVKFREDSPERKMTLKLKTEDKKLTGKLSMPGRDGGAPREVDIEQAQLKGDELTFNVVREMNGNKFVSKYVGKLSGNTIKGKIETERNGEKMSRDWEAKRETEKK